MEGYMFPTKETSCNLNNVYQNRKRASANDETHELQTKISKEAKKIIKMKVDNDLIKKELKNEIEGLKSTKSLQHQTIVQQQMQIETLSANYKNELRGREELLQKISNTRRVSNILEKYSEDLRHTLLSCQADQKSLCDAYLQAKQAITDIRESQDTLAKRHLLSLECLQDKLTAEKNLHMKTSNDLNELKHQQEEMILQLKNQISAQSEITTTFKKEQDDLRSAYKNDSLNMSANLKQKEEVISECKSQFQSYKTKMTEKISELERKIINYEQIIFQNKLTISHHVENIEKLTNENINNKDIISTLENENVSQADLIQKLKLVDAELEQLRISKQESARTEAVLNERCDELNKKLNESQVFLSAMETQKSEIENQLTKEINELKNSLDDIKQKFDYELSARHNAEKEIKILETYKTQLEAKLEVQSQQMEEKVADLNELLSVKGDSIKSLMFQLKMSTDLKAKLESALEDSNNKINSLKQTEDERIKSFEDKIRILKMEISIMKDSLKKSDDTNSELKLSLKNIEMAYNQEINALKKSLEDAKIKAQSPTNNYKSNHKPIATVTTNPTNSDGISNNDKQLNNINSTWRIPPPKNHKPDKNISDTNDKGFLSDSSFDGYTFDMEDVRSKYKELTTGNTNTSPVKLIRKKTYRSHKK